MSPDNIAFVKGVIAFVLVAGTGMSALWLWLRERRRSLPGAGQDLELAQLKQHLEQHTILLEEAHGSLAGQAALIAELQERLDFAERLLAQARDRAALGAGQKRD